MTTAARAGVRRPGPRRPPNVVEEIAARRRTDVAAGLTRSVDLAAAPPPRPIAERLAAPGLHLIAEVKRRSPSAGRIAGADEDIVARARAYAAGGAAAISVLCEPHWFGGSLDDLRAVRAAVSVPVLAKEFVVDARQLPSSGPPAPTSCSCWRCSIRRDAWRGSWSGRWTSAWSRSSRPTTPASCERALATDARLIGINNRDLRTLAVDTDAGRPAARARAGRSPGHRRVRGPRHRDRRPLAGTRVRRGARRRGADALRRSRRGGRVLRGGRSSRRTDPANGDRRPFVKICGVTDAAAPWRGRARRCGRDRAQPRARDAAGPRRGRGGELARLVRACSRPGHRGRGSSRSPPTRDGRSCWPRSLRPLIPTRSSSTAPNPSLGSPPSPRPAWKALHAAPRATPADGRARRRDRAGVPGRRCRPASSSTPPAGPTRVAPGCAPT